MNSHFDPKQRQSPFRRHDPDYHEAVLFHFQHFILILEKRAAVIKTGNIGSRKSSQNTIQIKRYLIAAKIEKHSLKEYI